MLEKLPLFLLPLLIVADRVFFSQIKAINSWWPPQNVAAGIGTPGFAPQTIYNHLSLSVWTCSKGPQDLAQLWNDPVKYLSTQSQFGQTNETIRQKIKLAFKQRKMKLLVTALGSTEQPVTMGQDPTKCAMNLAEFILNTSLDGTDIKFADQKAFDSGTAEQWLITFTKQLRLLLPNHTISHSPEASLFDESSFKSGGYMKVHKQVGGIIDFYNVRYYGEQKVDYSTFETLFLKSGPTIGKGTSVKELINIGIPQSKIILGKPVSTADIGYVDPLILGNYTTSGVSQVGWNGGIMLAGYEQDQDGKKAFYAAHGLLNASDVEKWKTHYNISTFEISPSVSPRTANAIPITAQFVGTAPVQFPITQKLVNYPIKFVYVNRVDNWWPPQKLMADIGVPGYAKDTMYEYVAFTFWRYDNGHTDTIKFWDDPIKYLTNSTKFGSTKQQIQLNIKQLFASKGIKLIVSAFGPSEMPATNGVDPTDCAIRLANFVIQNGLDGVDVDFQDSKSLASGTGEQWLITFTRKLRQLLPNLTISHAPQAPYFESERYSKGGYMMVEQQVGALIDFYNVQYYNQGVLSYDTHQKLFLSSSLNRELGSSVSELHQRGIAWRKIVVGKPASEQNSYNSGYMKPADLEKAFMEGFVNFNWYGGMMVWEYNSDKDGQMIQLCMQALDNLCSSLKFCY